MIGTVPEFSVSGFVAVYNQTLDTLYPEVVITGELSNFRISKNAWVYFDLKDESASVKFFGTVRTLPGPMEDGMLLEVVCRPYLHPQFGFSMQIISVQVVGEGSLAKAFLLLQRKLETEGLFDPTRKRPLPYAPNSIAIVASKESAGYGDFMKILSRRWPATDTTLYDVQVQGREAPAQLVSAVEKANKTAVFDVLVIIRGGGSRDDLAAFDHESVVRSVAGSRLPTLVAIGHERDVVLSELVADVRASTPSNAAEILVPDRVSEMAWLRQAKIQIDTALNVYKDQVEQAIQTYDKSLASLLEGYLSNARQNYEHQYALIDAYDPKQPLKRGYIIAKSNTGKILRSRVIAKEADNFILEFNDGMLHVTVSEEKNGKR